MTRLALGSKWGLSRIPANGLEPLAASRASKLPSAMPPSPSAESLRNRRRLIDGKTDEKLNKAELGAATSVALTILNHDAAVMRR